MKKRSLVLALIIIGVIGYFAWDIYQKRLAVARIEASGTISTTEVTVGSRVGGRIQSVDVQEGDMVKVGQPLIHLDPYQIPEQRAALKAELAQAQALLLELERGARPEEIAAARAQYQAAQAQASLVAEGARPEEIAQAAASRRQAEAELAQAESQYQRYQSLLKNKVISQQEFDAVATTYRSAQERVTAAREREQELRRGSRPQEIEAAREQARAQQEQLQLLEAGTRSEDIAAQRAMVDRIKAQLAQLETTARELTVNAPCTCQVSSMDLKPGQLVAPNQTVAELVNLNDLWVRVFIPEERFGLVQPGDPAIVHVDPYPKRDFSGKVMQIASRAEFTPRNVQTEESRRKQVFGIKVAIDNKALLLRPGMPADVTFPLQQRAQR